MKTYLEITKIHLANPTPQTDETVWVSVMVKNLTLSPITVRCNANFNGVAFIHFIDKIVASGLTYTFGGNFTMPAANVIISASVSYLGTDDSYHLDDELTANITGQPGEPPAGLPPGEGNYLDITDVIITPNPQLGETVWVSVFVKNNHSGAVNARCLANLDILTYIIAEDRVIASGDTYEFKNWFTMPSGNVVISAYTYHQATDGAFYYNDQAIVDIGGVNIEEHQLQVLISPAIGGSVTTLPMSRDGKLYWNDKDTGVFIDGTNVQAMGIPNSGYIFEKWTEDIVGGISYVNPSYVQMMTQPRVLKCFFVPGGDGNGDGDGDGDGELIPGTKVKDYLYPLASTYVGNAEKCTFTFSLGPEQIPGTDWLADQVINNFTSEVEKQNAKMLKLEVYEDASPTWKTNYTVVATSTASPVPWLLIIGAVMLLLFLIPIVFVIIDIIKFVWAVGKTIFDTIGEIIPMLIIVLIITMVMKMFPGITGNKPVPKLGPGKEVLQLESGRV